MRVYHVFYERRQLLVHVPILLFLDGFLLDYLDGIFIFKI